MQIQQKAPDRRTRTMPLPPGAVDRRTVEDRRQSATPASGGRRAADASDSVSIGQATDGNRITPLIGGDQIFPNAEKLIRGASSTVRLEMYRLGYDKMVQALADQARSGKVKVQILLDPTPGYDAADAKNQAAIQKYLTDAGVEILKYPIHKAGAIDHVKLLIVDGKQAIIGGMNWDQHSPKNMDADVLVEGPAVSHLEQVMDEDWQFAGGTAPESTGAAPQAPVQGGDARVRVLTTNPDKGRQDIRQGILDNINKAQHSIHMMAFTLADKDVIDALIKAKKERNVDVKVLLDPNKPVVFPNEKTASVLKAAGIDVRWLDVNMDTEEKLHAKLCTFDNDTVVLGSANFTHNGYAVNHEADVEVQSKTASNAFDSFFQDQWDHRSLKNAPDVPDWEAKAPQGDAADQIGHALVGYFKDNYTPDDRSRLSDALKQALGRAEADGGKLQAIPKIDADALTTYVQSGPHAADDDQAKGKKIQFIGDLAGYLAQPGLFKLDPAPGDLTTPMWKERLDVSDKASQTLPTQVPHMVQSMIDTLQAPDVRAFVKEAFDKVPQAFYQAPSSSTGKFHPADEVDPNTLRPEEIKKRAEHSEHPEQPLTPPANPYHGGGLVLHSARVVAVGDRLCKYFGVTGRDRDLVLAGLALHDIMKFATKAAVDATPAGQPVPWTQYTTPDHGPAGAAWVQKLDPAHSDIAAPIAHYIDDHMAHWNAPKETPPADINDLIVSLSDYVASLPNFYVNV